jgi:predicted O-methyltransferase YrrM
LIPWRTPLHLFHDTAYRARRRLRRAEPLRYGHLIDTIDRCRSRRILEIGTWNGRHAEDMIRAAMKYWPRDQVEYYGFDMFEDIDSAKIAAEISKRPPPQKTVEARLRATGARIQLFKGDTTATLPETASQLPPMDLIFIDGGHSYETVSNDWEHCRRLMHGSTVVLLDDYWDEPDAGTDRVVREIDESRYDVKVLDPEDTFVKEWGILRVRFVRVQLRATTDPAAS